MNKNDILTSLYEISLNIGISLELEELLDNALSTYMRQLSCSGVLVVSNFDGKIDFPYIRPKVLAKNKKMLEEIETVAKQGCKECDLYGYKTLVYDDQFVYLAKLQDYGYLILIRNNEEFGEYLLKSLNPINKKMSLAVISSINNQKLRINEQAMYQQSKMAAMGEMMSNIAHQWRQPLQVISISTQKLQFEMMIKNGVTQQDIDKMCDNVSTQLDYLTQTIEDFRSFFRPDKEKHTFNIQKTIDKTISLTTATLKKYNITLLVHNQSKIDTMYSLENELLQVFINIIKNGCDILVEKEVEHKVIILQAIQDDNDLIFRFFDNGGGVPEKIKDKIFEPYFTTKHQSIGTGLGLYMSYEIVTKHLGGDLRVENKEFEYQDKKLFGACFEVKLPL